MRCTAASLAPGIFNFVQVQIIAPWRASVGQYLNLSSEIRSGSADPSPGNNTDTMRAMVSGVR